MNIAEADMLNSSILIVDDQAANVNLLEQLLHESGYTRVTSTRNPREVCALNRAHRYDLILLDLLMPDMDGFAVMKALEADLDLLDTCVPVLVLTAQPEHKLRALQAGARDFVSKPFDLVEVKTRIRNMLEVCLLYKKLSNYSALLELEVQARTADLLESEARYRALVELAADWYWEQDEQGHFTKVSGPVLEILGFPMSPLGPLARIGPAGRVGSVAPVANHSPATQGLGWNEAERLALQVSVAAREPFLDFVFNRVNADGSAQKFHVSGEPIFNQSCRFIGYRGIGVEVHIGV